VGYDGARRLSHKWLKETLSDDGTAKSAFLQSLGIRTANNTLIRRIGLNRNLDEWWDNSASQFPAVAVGEEGTGKTWAVFDWVMGRVESSEMPIVLPVAAVKESLSGGDTVETILPRLLARVTGTLDEARWKRRVDRWMMAAGERTPLILLVIDGLNERARLQWRPFFSTLLGAVWRGKVAVLATDRPHHWREQEPIFARYLSQHTLMPN
jgi:hypothetical protein